MNPDLPSGDPALFADFAVSYKLVDMISLHVKASYTSIMYLDNPLNDVTIGAGININL